MTHPALISDDLDDLRGVDPFASTAPRVESVPAGFAPLFCKVAAISISDPGFVAIVAPDVALTMGSAAGRFAKGVTQTSAYQAAPGARNAMRSDLHATGVIR